MSGSRGWKAVGLAAVLAGLMLWWWWPSASEAPAAPALPRTASVEPAPSEAPPPPARETPREAVAGRLLRARLVGARPFSGQARVGAALISEEDRAEWEASRREGRRGAGPQRLEELANVAEWEDAPVTAEASGGGVLGPVPVPVAPRYRLLAWEEDGLLWWGDFIPPEEAPAEGVLDAGELRPVHPTGLRVRLSGVRPVQGARYALRVERVVAQAPTEAARASDWLPVVHQVAPRLASALQDEVPLALSPEEDTLLSPLPPDAALRLRLRTEAGRESEPVEVPLREGRVETVVLEPARLFPEGEGGLVELRGRLLLGGTSHPPPGVRIEHEEAPEGAWVYPEADGRFRVPRLPTWRPSRFIAVTEPPETGRPVAPARWAFEFSPPREAEAAEFTWRVPAYQWLVLKLDAFTRGQLEARARGPYPVFLLQQRGEDGAWRVRSADTFHREPDGVAVSLTGPGTYRVLAAASPYEVYESAGVTLGEEDTERSVPLRVTEEAAVCEVHVTSAGRPVYGALVTAAGGQGSLPPVRGRTDAEGRWRLGRVRGGALHLEVEAEGHAVWAGEPVADCQRGGVIEVRL